MAGVATLHVQPHNHGTLMAASNMGICKPHRFFPQTEMNKFHGKTMKFRDKPTQERMTSRGRVIYCSGRARYSTYAKHSTTTTTHTSSRTHRTS
eukprot:g5130.t1